MRLDVGTTTVLLVLALPGCGDEFAAEGSGGAAGNTGGLISRGVLTRYFIDEAASGQEPTSLRDAASEPLDLPLLWGPELSYDEVAGHRGLRWIQAGADAKAAIQVDGTKLLGLDGTTEATIEVVVDIDAVNDSRISYIGSGSAFGYFSLLAFDLSSVSFSWQQDIIAGRFPVAWDATGRLVLHLVLDTNQAVASDRVRFYVDGKPVLALDGQAPTQGEKLSLPSSQFYVLGNRDRERSPEGVLYYAALYRAALAEHEVAANAAALSTSDDGPS